MRELGGLFGGSTPDTNDSSLWDGNIRWLVPSEISALQDHHIFLCDTESHLTERGYDSCSTYLLPRGAVAVSSRATVGDCIVLARPTCTNQGFVSIVCNNNIYNIFLLYWVRHNKAYIARFAAGTTFDEIGRRTFKNLKVRHPTDVTEQKAIARAIAATDAAIASTEFSIAKAELLQKGMMQQLLSGRVKLDGTPRTRSEFKEDSKLGLIPKDWIVDKGLKLAQKITKGQSPKWQGFDYANSGMLFVTSENVRDGFLDLTAPKFLPLEFNEKIKSSELRPNDILINLVGASIGRSCLFDSDYTPANVNQAVCVFRPKPGIVSRYLAYYLRLDSTRNRLLSSQVETARSNLSLGDVRRLKFALPQDEAEQIEIADRLHSITELTDAKKQKISALQLLKKSLMQNLFEGRIRLRMQASTTEVIR